MAIDVMDMLHGDSLSDAVAIVSSDADFAPLALRLRESGLQVMCFARHDHADRPALARAYDEVIYVNSTLSLEPALETLNAVPVPVPAPEVKPVAKPVVVADVVTEDAEDVSAVRRILAELPDWLPNTMRQLTQIGSKLRASGLAKRSKPLHELFSKYPSYFQLFPMDDPPKQVRLLKNPLPSGKV